MLTLWKGYWNIEGEREMGREGRREEEYIPLYGKSSCVLGSDNECVFYLHEWLLGHRAILPGKDYPMYSRIYIYPPWPLPMKFQ